jgi:hypothetical protein
VLGGAGDHLDELRPDGGRRLQVAVESDDDRHPERRAEKRERHGVDQRRVQVEDVRAGHLGQRPREDRGRHERLAHAHGHRRADHAHAVLLAFERELRQVPVGQDAHRVPAPCEALRQVFDVESQARDVGAVVVDRHQDLHFGRATVKIAVPSEPKAGERNGKPAVAGFEP